LNSVTDFNGNQINITSNSDSLPTSATLGSAGDTITAAYDSTDSPSAIALKSGSTTLASFSYLDAPAGTSPHRWQRLRRDWPGIPRKE
jgi:hypothetical protein